MVEKVVSLSLLMLVSIIVARHLGPESYGTLSYAISLATLFTIATHLGLHGLAIRELVTYPDDHRTTLGTIFYLKLLGALLAIVVYLGFVISTEQIASVEFWVMLLASGLILFKPFEVFDFWFQAQVKAKYSAMARGIATILFALLCTILVITSAQVIAFAKAYFVQALLIGTLFLLFFRSVSLLPLKELTFRLSRAKGLVRQSWMIMLGALFAMVYLKVDQIMLRWLVSAEEVGIYSVAARLSETWYFIPTLIVASIFPKLIELRQDNYERFQKRLQQLFDLLFSMALLLAFVVTFISEPLITILYGIEYKGAALILSIHIWAGIFIFMRAAFSKWILIEDAISFSMITQGLGALFNILLNILLIPVWQGIGAATATIISYAIASYLSLVFYKKSRPVFWMMSKAMISPLRYVYGLLK